MSARHLRTIGDRVKIHNDDLTVDYGHVDSYRPSGVRVRMDSGRYRMVAWWRLTPVQAR
jgi:hypothetical protein